MPDPALSVVAAVVLWLAGVEAFYEETEAAFRDALRAIAAGQGARRWR